MQQPYECNKHLWLARLEDSDKSTTLVDTDGLQSVRADRRRMTGDIVDVKAEWTGRSPSTRPRRRRGDYGGERSSYFRSDRNDVTTRRGP